MGNEEKVTEERENKEILNIANELLQVMKEKSERDHKALVTVVKLWFGTVVVGLIMVLAFVWYLYQYDFTATVEQTGIYTLMDSQGNVLSTDLTADDIIKIEEILENGKNKGSEVQE